MSDENKAVAIRDNNMAVGQALAVDDIIAQVRLIQQVMSKVMTDGEHYGTIPGCGDKKTLLQPGAQKLTMTFRLAPEYQLQETDLPRGHKEYRVICSLKSIQTGNFVGQGVGCCSSMESKYRWRGGTRVCPQCGKDAIIQGKKFRPTDPEPGWLCWTKKGGCGATWPKGATEIESQSLSKVENENPADTFNTVLKMAKKRAFVDATITATAASDIFTQDVGDEEGEEPPPHKETPQPQRKPEPPKPQTATQATTPDKLKATFLKRIADAKMDIAAWGWLVEVGSLLPNERLSDLPADKAPTTKEQYENMVSQIEAFAAKSRGDTMDLDRQLVQDFDDVHRTPAEPEDQIPGAEMPPQAAHERGQGNSPPSVTGVIGNVSIKTGTSKRGAWTLFGIAIEGTYYNCFSKSLGDYAIKLKGETVELFYEETDKGNAALAIRHGGKLVEASE